MKATADETFFIPTGDRHPVRADLYRGGDGTVLCILCHGFKGHKSWGFLPSIASRLSREGISALCMDFSHNGTIPPAGTEGARRSETSPGALYLDPKLFSRNTLSREVSDLASVIEFSSSGRIPGLASIQRIGLFGHSRGGVSALLNALRYEKVRALATWSMPVHPDVFSEQQKKRWREERVMAFIDSSSNTSMCVDVSYLEDIERNRDLFDMEKAAAGLAVPHLLVHGALDIPIPAEAAVRLFRAEKQLTARRLLLVKSGHTFGVANPGRTNGEALARAIDVTALWFKKHLTGGEEK